MDDESVELNYRGVNVDPLINVVMFELHTSAGTERIICETQTRADDAIRQAWASLQANRGAHPNNVARIYSEWQPSEDDARFLNSTFHAPYTYTFVRPAPNKWNGALKSASRAIRRAEGPRGEPESIPNPQDPYSGKSGRVRKLMLMGALAVLSIAVGIWQYHDLGELEARGGSRTMNAVVGLLYDAGGRNAVVAFFMLAATMWIYIFIKTAREIIQRKSKIQKPPQN